MTKAKRAVSRECEGLNGTYIVTLNEVGISLREKGRRVSFTLPYDLAYLKAATIAANKALAEPKVRRVNRNLLTTRDPLA